MDTNNNIKDLIKTLSRGLMQSDYSVAFEGYKGLYKYGQLVVPYLKDLLLSIDWSKSKYKELSIYFAGIFSLIHDIDETQADLIQKALNDNGCPKHITALINSKKNFSTKNYIRYKINEIEILEHNAIEKKCDISKYIESWLENIPIQDLDEISRIYIVSYNDVEGGNAGTYTPGLFKIALGWDNPYKENAFLFKISALMTEKVLYHEVGHHAHRHNFWQHTSDKEIEADTYAFKIMRQTHPILHIWARFFNVIGFKSQRNYFRWGL